MVREKVALPDLVARSRIEFKDGQAAYDSATLRDGGIAKTLETLKGYAADTSKAARVRSNAWLVGSHLLWCDGNLKEALIWIDRAAQADSSTDVLLMKAHLLEASGDVDQARVTYEQVKPLLTEASDREKVTLRLTFIEVGKSNIKALIDLANTRDRDFRNRAAIALAVLNHHDEARKLYEIGEGEKSTLLREHLRLSQWSLRAGDFMDVEGACLACLGAGGAAA